MNTPKQESYVEVDSKRILSLINKMVMAQRLIRQRYYRALIRSLMRPEKRVFFNLIRTRKAINKQEATKMARKLTTLYSWELGQMGLDTKQLECLGYIDRKKVIEFCNKMIAAAKASPKLFLTLDDWCVLSSYVGEPDIN